MSATPAGKIKIRSFFKLPFTGWRTFPIQLFLFMILPVTILLFVIVFWSFSLHQESMHTMVGNRDLLAVRAAANSFTREIEQMSLSLQLASARLQNTSPSNPDIDKISIPVFDRGIALVDSRGILLKGQLRGLGNSITSQLPSQSSPVVFSKPYKISDGSWAVLASTSISSGYHLVGAFSPTELARRALSGVTNPLMTVFLVSSTGDILYQFGHTDHAIPLEKHPGIAEVLRGESGVNYYRGPEHGGDLSGINLDEYVVSFSPVKPFGWGLVLEESWSTIASPLLSTTQFTPLILVPVLLLTVSILWFGARQIVQPLQALENRAARLASGDFSAIRDPVGGIAEIRLLQQALVETTRALENAEGALRGYIGSLTSGVENERRGLARELHDETLQTLIALNQRIQLSLRLPPGETQKNALLELQAQATQAISELRRTIVGLRPIYLEDLGLVAALGMLSGDTNKASGVNCRLVVKGEERRLPPEVEMAFYRIAQEALNNTLHHAGATQSGLTLVFENDALCLSIFDNGKGFLPPQDRSAFARQGHYGLLGMRERAELIGAEFELDSHPGQGVTINILWRKST